MSEHGTEAAKEHGIERSTHWPHVRAEVLDSQLAAWRVKIKDFDEKYNGVEWEVHHRIAFHFGALLGLGYIELDVRNLIVAPRHPVDLHLLLGHLDDFRSFNVDVAKFLKLWGGELWGGVGSFLDGVNKEDHSEFGPIEDQIKADGAWLRAHMGRPRSWGAMTEHDKKGLAFLIRTELPLVHSGAA